MKTMCPGKGRRKESTDLPAAVVQEKAKIHFLEDFDDRDVALDWAGSKFPARQSGDQRDHGYLASTVSIFARLGM